MRSTRSMLTGLLALSLTMAIPAMATGQEAATESNELTYTTGSPTGDPARFIPPTEETLVDGIGVMRGRQVIGVPQEFTDPRLSGVLSMAANGAGQEFDDGWAQIESRTYRIENEDGAWTGSGISALAIGSDEPLFDKDAMVLTGEGAYDGLIAYVFAAAVDDEVVLEAIVLENELPPVPEPLAANVLGDIPTFAALDDLDPFVSAFVGDVDGGAVALVTRGDETATIARGTANAAGDPVDVDTAFHVASTTKPFVSTMVLQLVDEGQVELDAPLSTYLPGTSVGGDVTIRQLLSHRSGIADYVSQPGFFEMLFVDPEQSLSVEDIIGSITDEPAGEPDTAFSYSNTNYILLGQMVETVDGVDLETALRNRIAEPLGLEATTFDVDTLPPGAVAGSWTGDLAGDPVPESISSSAWSAGALVSTPADLATFLSALFDGRLISEDLLGEMLDTGPEGYGLGIATMPPGAEAGGFYGHTGGGPGIRSWMGGDPETGDVVIVLSNSDALDTDWAADQILGAWANSDG